MKTSKSFKICSIAIMSIGVIHTLATLFLFPFFASSSNVDPTAVFMFVMTGAGTFLTGWIQYFAVKHLPGDKKMIVPLKVSVIFLSMLGLGVLAIAFISDMWKNPFAGICVLIMLYEWYLYPKTRKTSFNLPKTA
ncbi:MAG: hypothetical protein JXQ80_10265 [Bacteroidales bacterium]|nr:hypothetical protein [Bacteroidales bacterium]